MKTKWTSYIPVALIVAFLGAFLVWPMLHVFAKACVDKQGITGLYLLGLFRNPVQREAALNSLQIAFYVTIGGTNKFKVTSTEAVFNTPIVRLNALDMVTTPLPPATPVTLQGYVPLSVNGVPYYVPFYT